MLDFIQDVETQSVPGSDKPMRILSVSGGGLLGVIPAAMLMRYEALGKAAYGANYKLCDSFDMVGGTSTGAVIATGVALGLEAREIANFYLMDVPKGFRKRWGAVPFLHDIFNGGLMQRFFDGRCQGRVLSRAELECDLTIMVKDLTRSRPLAFTTLQSDVTSLYGAEIRREAIELSSLLRASTAAPGLFSPQSLRLETGEEILGIDGGLSPFNNPSCVLGKLGFGGGAEMVDLISLGTGNTRPRYKAHTLRRQPAALRALTGLMSMLKDGEVMAETMLDEMAQTRSFSHRHIDMALRDESFEALGVILSRSERKHIRQISDFRGKERLFELAGLVAEQEILEALPLRGPVPDFPCAVKPLDYARVS